MAKKQIEKEEEVKMEGVKIEGGIQSATCTKALPLREKQSEQERMSYGQNP